jgi:hypothetical protein
MNKPFGVEGNVPLISVIKKRKDKYNVDNQIAPKDAIDTDREHC